MPQPSAIVVWDLDGTLYPPEEPCRQLGERLAGLMAPDARVLYLSALNEHFARDNAPCWADNWTLVSQLAGRYLPQVDWTDAFLSAAADSWALLSPQLISPRFRQLVARSRPTVRHLLMTASPPVVAAPRIARLDLWACFDVIAMGAQKPRDLQRAVREIWEGPAIPSATAVVGDHYEMDIRLPYAWGWQTFYVSARFPHAGPSSFHVSSLEEAVDRLYDWLEDVESLSRETAHSVCYYARPGSQADR